MDLICGASEWWILLRILFAVRVRATVGFICSAEQQRLNRGAEPRRLMPHRGASANSIRKGVWVRDSVQVRQGYARYRDGHVT